MSTTVDYDDLLSAFEWVASGEVAAVEADAFISRLTGSIHWRGDGVDEALPAGVDDERLYIAVPRKHALDLGRALVFRFVAEHMPSSSSEVGKYFHRRGAYSHFKALLERTDRLDDWYRYEEAATDKALDQWCADNGFVITRRARGG